MAITPSTTKTWRTAPETEIQIPISPNESVPGVLITYASFVDNSVYVNFQIGIRKKGKEHTEIYQANLAIDETLVQEDIEALIKYIDVFSWNIVRTVFSQMYYPEHIYMKELDKRRDLDDL